MSEPESHYGAFRAHVRVASGGLRDVALALHALAETDPALVLVFDDRTGRQLDLDLRGSRGDVAERFDAPAAESAIRGRDRALAH